MFIQPLFRKTAMVQHSRRNNISKRFRVNYRVLGKYVPVSDTFMLPAHILLRSSPWRDGNRMRLWRGSIKAQLVALYTLLMRV